MFNLVLWLQLLARLVKRKVAMLRAFRVGFEKVLNGSLLLFGALLGVIEIFLHSC